MARSVTIQELTTLAGAGDVAAQYALSAALHERGQHDDSLRWLRLAAERGFPPARMTLATMLTDGRRCARDLARAIDLVSPLAHADPQANLLLAEIHGYAALGVGDRERGLRYLVDAARLGDAGAARQLALLAVGQRCDALVRPLLDHAARRGDGQAAHALASCVAAGIGGLPDAALAAAIAATPAASSQYLGRAAPRAAGAALPAVAVDWVDVERAVPVLASDLPLPVERRLAEAPLVRKFARAIHPVVLDAIINLAAPLVQRSQIVDAHTGQVRADPMRTSFHVTLSPRQHDHVVEAVERCIGRVSGLPTRNAEFLQILRYRIGEEFRPHVDYFNEGGAGAYRSLADGGQRAQTVLIYLNDGYAGGSTRFPTLGLDVQGERGDLVHFHNLGADGLGDRASLHAGMPVLAGEKWLLSQWIRSDTYQPRSAW